MARRRYILSIDQGTSGSTVLLIDTYGEIAARGYCEFTQQYPHPGWVEHDATEIWELTRNVISNLVNAHGVAQKIAAIGLANQCETTVVWDRRTGKPIHPAIVWQCRRTSGVCEDLKARGVEDCVRAKTGLVLDAYFSATKIAWILDSVDGARERAERGELAFGTIDAWLLWNLTAGAVHATDYTNASRTMLFNIDALAWDDELLAEFRVPQRVLPEVQPSASVFGKTANTDPLPNGIPISGIAGDQQAALFGQLCTQPPMAKNTYGTGCFLMLNTGDRRVRSKSGLLTTLACGMDEKPVFALEGSVFIAGAAIQWLRDGLKVIKSASETETIAASVADSGGVFVVPAFTGLGAPYWDANARGAILGLTRGTTRAHIVRATLESIAFQTADVVTAMVADAGIELDRLRVDGGASANNLLMQVQADVLGIDVERPTQTETTGLGAGYCAGLTVGIWHSVKDLQSHRKIDAVFSPQLRTRQRTEKLEAWRAVVGKVMS